MPSIFAEGVEINIQDGQWRMYNVHGSNSITPFFYVMRGANLIHYTSAFGSTRGLPGDVLSTEYVKAVVVGFEEKLKRWIIGFQIATTNTEKPRFVELARWPATESPEDSANSHDAARILAEYISSPLKLFGVKKPQTEGRTPTGPLQPHQRLDITTHEVHNKAQSITLPISEGEIWLGKTRDLLTLRIPREASNKNGETPAYTQAAIDQNAQMIRLVPPTGLIGTFFGPGGRTIKFQDIRNIELRHIISIESTLQKDQDGMDVEAAEQTHQYGVYLTLADESLMLVHLMHQEFARKIDARIKTRTLTDSNSAADVELQMARLRQHQLDQQRRERQEDFMEAIALSIADTINKPLVVTTVGDTLS